MLKVELLALGNLKEKYWQDACAEYIKRLSRYCKFVTNQCKELSVKDNPTAAEITQLLNKEAESLLKRIQPNDYVVCLAIDGEMPTSEKLAKKLGTFAQQGQKIIFIIGSSHGLAEKIYKRANWRLSFSNMTFPHQMMRVIFLEQLYRGFKINNNENYHK